MYMGWLRRTQGMVPTSPTAWPQPPGPRPWESVKVFLFPVSSFFI